MTTHGYPHYPTIQPGRAVQAYASAIVPGWHISTLTDDDALAVLHVDTVTLHGAYVLAVGHNCHDGQYAGFVLAIESVVIATTCPEELALIDAISRLGSRLGVEDNVIWLNND